MSTPAVRVRTSSGWQDVATVGPPGGPQPQLKVYRTSGLSITGGAFTPIPFQATEYDLNSPSAQWAVGDPTKVFARVDGIYLLEFRAYFDSQPGAKSLYFQRHPIGGGAKQLIQPGEFVAGQAWLGGLLVQRLVAGEAISVEVVVGTTATLRANQDYSGVLTMTRISPLYAEDSIGIPADATPSSKGIIQLAGDLAGTAAAPQIAAGAIVNADINAAAAIGDGKLARTEEKKPQLTYAAVGGGESGDFTTAIEILGRHAITPSVNVWWMYEFWTMIYTTTGAWCLCDGLVDLAVGSPTVDANNVGAWRSREKGHNAFSYASIHTQALMKLNAGSTYTARSVLVPVNGTWRWYNNSMYSYVYSHVVGYW